MYLRPGAGHFSATHILAMLRGYGRKISNALLPKIHLRNRGVGVKRTKRKKESSLRRKPESSNRLDAGSKPAPDLIRGPA